MNTFKQLVGGHSPTPPSSSSQSRRKDANRGFKENETNEKEWETNDDTNKKNGTESKSESGSSSGSERSSSSGEESNEEMKKM